MKRPVLVTVLVLAFPSIVCAAPGWREVRQGNRAFTDGDFAAATAFYEKALEKAQEAPVVEYNLGTARQKAGDQDKAVDHLRRALLMDDEKVLPLVRYNLGRALYYKGMARGPEDRDGAIKDLEESLGYFQKVMDEDPKDEDARFNHEVVKRELERLKVQPPSSSSCPLGKNDKDQQGDPQKKDEGSQDQKAEARGESGEQEAGERAEGSKGAQDPREDSSLNDVPEPGEREDSAQEDRPDEDQGEGASESSQGPAGDEEKEGASSGQVREGGLLSEKEAQAMLDEFGRQEEPKGLLNLVPRSGKNAGVVRDW
ncbi:MAG: tetratricopeptide repeat protein [Elusimicrobia bacterium]|nr:tetratricopeptide repeat protein [Elusimicrobiota bacterium]